MDQLSLLRKEMKRLSSPEKAKASRWFFKTGEGQYGFGDQFIGLTVPEQRVLSRKFKQLSLQEIEVLLHSKIHEERLTALMILVLQFFSAKNDKKKRKKIYNFFLKNTKYVNNWDLVDSSAGKIVGEYLVDEKIKRGVLGELAKSAVLWERRIAIVATHAFINRGDDSMTHEIAEVLLDDKHDLMHKAVGWMLREAGKKVSKENLEQFLKKHYKTMPRTTLRYAIEHFPPDVRKKYLLGQI